MEGKVTQSVRAHNINWGLIVAALLLYDPAKTIAEAFAAWLGRQ